jgi:predicted enzyme related to lactoylglutathione lyase
MEWKDKIQRSVKDLPIKLTFSVPNVKKAQDQVVANGGPIVEVKSSEIPGALYAKDPDGYLLELIPSNTTYTYLSGVTIGTSDIAKKAEFWSKTTEMKSTEVRKLSEGDEFTLSGAFGGTLSFVQLNESPKRSTLNLPYKVVISVDKGNDYAAAVKKLGGKEILPIALLGGTIGFVEDPNDRTTIEINSGLIRGPP